MWIKDYLGTIQFDPAEELMEIPNHSAFFILSPDNRLTNIFACVCVLWMGWSVYIDRWCGIWMVSLGYRWWRQLRHALKCYSHALLQLHFTGAIDHAIVDILHREYLFKRLLLDLCCRTCSNSCLHEQESPVLSSSKTHDAVIPYSLLEWEKVIAMTLHLHTVWGRPLPFLLWLKNETNLRWRVKLVDGVNE